MKKIISLMILFLSIFSLLGCSSFLNHTSKSNTTVKVSSKSDRLITTKNSFIELNVGEKTYLDYKLNFTLKEGESVEYYSSNPEVCKVLSTGYVLAKGKGTCLITVSYEEASLVYQVTVNQESELVAPDKLEYFIGESIDLTGAQIIFYFSDQMVDKIVSIDESMISGFDTSIKGTKEVTVTYNGDTYKFQIEVKDREFEAYFIKDVIIPETINLNEKLEIKIENNNLNALKEKIESLYDYSKYKIQMEINTPSQKKDKVLAFITQDFDVTKTNKTLSTSRNLEGQVNSKEGYNYKTTFTKNGDNYYMFRYLPKESGTYDYVIKVYVNDSTVVETLEGSFNVTGSKTTKGVIKVSDNKKTFEYANGDSCLLVGENVGWYTSSERRIGDYELWFSSMYLNKMNYARVWLSGWGFGLFWDNYKNYDTRLDEAYELDMLFDMAEEYSININLTFFQHGMFSEKTNPMWPNTSNTWYIDKYGANPYSKLLSSPKDFFTNKEALKWTKNYIYYIVSRYGYSESLLSYELFNEVDWVESYTKSVGNEWHDQMAKTIKNVDYSHHLVTTSVKGDNFNSDIYTVFNLDSIDYVNVHNYGTYNYLNYIPKKVMEAYKIFDKPIMYQEVGYSGNGGADQISKDKNDVTLHQEIWAGLMSSGASGMNWWWDSWIEVNNSYSKYKGASIFRDLINLNGDMSLAYSSSRITNSSSKVITLGYLFKDKAYLYVYNSDYSLDNSSVSLSTKLKVSSLDNGTYKVSFYDTTTGNLKETKSINVTKGTIEISISSTNDIAIIITK